MIRTLMGMAMSGLLLGNGVAGAPTQNSPPTFPVAVSEVATHGPAGTRDEFVELKNVGATPQDLSGYKLDFFGNDNQLLARTTFPAETVLQPNEVLVLAGMDLSSSLENVNHVISILIDIPSRFGLRLSNGDDVEVDRCGTIPRWWPPIPWPCPCPPGPWPPWAADLSFTRHHLTGNNAVDYSLDVRTPGTSELLPQDPVPMTFIDAHDWEQQ